MRIRLCLLILAATTVHCSKPTTTKDLVAPAPSPAWKEIVSEDMRKMLLFLATSAASTGAFSLARQGGGDNFTFLSNAALESLAHELGYLSVAQLGNVMWGPMSPERKKNLTSFLLLFGARMIRQALMNGTGVESLVESIPIYVKLIAYSALGQSIVDFLAPRPRPTPPPVVVVTV